MTQENHSIIPPFTGKFKTILLFGPPGSGKGTLGKFLGSAGNQFHLSSGDVFRGLSPDSPAGQLFHSYCNKGLLLPDEVTIEIWHHYVSGLIATNRYFPGKQCLLLDGIPRTRTQAEILEQYIEVKQIVFLDIENKEELLKRLQKRALIERRSDDSDINVLRKRMDVYQTETLKILSYYPKHLISTFNADQRPLEVLRDVLVELSDILS